MAAALPHLRNYKTVICPRLWITLWIISRMCTDVSMRADEPTHAGEPRCTSEARSSAAQEAVQLFECDAVPVACPLEHARADEGGHLGGHADLRALGDFCEGPGHQSGGERLSTGAHGLGVDDGPRVCDLHVVDVTDDVEQVGGAAAVAGRSS